MKTKKNWYVLPVVALLLTANLASFSFAWASDSEQVDDSPPAEGADLATPEVEPLPPVTRKTVQEILELESKRHIDVDSFLVKSRQPDTVIIDTRPEGDYTCGHIAGAVNLGAGGINRKVAEALIPSKDVQVLLYGFFSVEAYPPVGAKRDMTFPLLYRLGYKNLYYLQSGMRSGADDLKKLPMVTGSGCQSNTPDSEGSK